MSLLEVRGLRVGYGRFPVLHGVDIDVAEGETAVLFGLNGAGKTTTVSTIAGLLRPWEGTITFDGEPVGGLPPADLVARGIVLVPEGRRVFPRLSVTNNLRMGAWVHRRDPATITRQLELAFAYFPRLAERRDQLAGTLSGGEQQMLAIARGLMARPRCMLIDEASLGLSPALAQTVLEVVARINADGTTVVIVEQNVSVLRYASRVYVLEKGTIAYHAAGDDIDAASIRDQYLGA